VHSHWSATEHTLTIQIPLITKYYSQDRKKLEMRGKAYRIARSAPQCRPLTSSTEPKPCYHLANVQRMHVVSVCLHYGNIIWLPWQRHLTNWSRSIIGNKVLSYGEKIAKIGPVNPEIFDKICRTTTGTHNTISIRMFSETTGPIFTKILHDIKALMALFNHAHTRRYPIPFLNARATSEAGRF